MTTFFLQFSFISLKKITLSSFSQFQNFQFFWGGGGGGGCVVVLVGGC
jgi:hypothetical protein